ncbi:MAG: phytoene desaturase [Bacteroidetes bacterium]|nr:phytoene desaturase [Bacteroidota bacterium]
MKNVNTIAIIGSGFGGLAEGVRLQARGFKVTIFEKRGQVGGRAYQLVKNGYTFDMGPSLVTAPFIIEDVFKAAGKSMKDYLSLVPLDPYYRIYYHDGTFLDYTSDPGRMKEQTARFNPKDSRNYDRFFEDVKPIYDAVITEGLGGTPFLTWKSFLSFAPRALRLGGLRPVYNFVSRYFQDERVRFAFSFHPLFIGGSPFRAPSIYTMIPYLEREAGVWFSMGGMYNVVRAIERVFRELGGTVYTNAEVQEILVENGRAVGVRVGGERHAADAVVSNGDVPWVYKNLLHAEHRGQRWSDRAIDRLHMSMSCYLLYVGVKRQYPQLKHHTLILSRRYRELVRDIFDRKILPEDFSLYLHVPTRTDPSMAPAGCESMYVLVPVPHLGENIDWKTTAGPFRDRILEFLEKDFGLEDLRQNIEVLEMFTPEDFQKHLNAHLGNAFSIEPRLTQSAYFRPHNRSEVVQGLYFVGAGTHPGGGVPGVLLGAEATEKCVLEDFRIQNQRTQGAHV